MDPEASSTGSAAAGPPGIGGNRGRQYRLVSELRRPGEQLSIPDSAENVSVDVLAPHVVRVTYLSPLYELGFEDGDGDPGPRYFD